MITPVRSIKSSARTYDSILAELIDIISATAGDKLSDLTESDIGQAWLQIMALVAEHSCYANDMVGQEIFLDTCRRPESALRFCRSVGYTPRMSVSAKAICLCAPVPSGISVPGGIVSAGTFVTAQNGLTYELVSDTVITPGSSSFQFVLVEGKTFTETYSPTRASRQQIVSVNGNVEDGSWSVYVGDVNNLGNRWRQVDKVALEISATKTYEVSFDSDGHLIITWGNGIQGAIPDQVVTLVYRISNGIAGNAPSGVITGNLLAHSFDNNAVVSLPIANSTDPASGGMDPESIEELRISVPAYIRSRDALITLQDYQESLRRIPGVVLGFADSNVSQSEGQIVRVYAWMSEDVNFTAI